MSGTTSVAPPTERKVQELESVAIRFAGDSGDGMQLAGTQFTNASAIFGNDISTFPDFPAEIRAPAGTLAQVTTAEGVAVVRIVHRTESGDALTLTQWRSDGVAPPPAPGERIHVLVWQHRWDAMSPADQARHRVVLRSEGTGPEGQDPLLLTELVASPSGPPAAAR